MSAADRDRHYGRRRKNYDPLQHVISQITEGSLVTFKDSIVDNLEPMVRERLKSDKVPLDRSLLVKAIQHGEKEIFMYLIDTYEVNIEQKTSAVFDGGHPIEGVTPLWTASTLGHLDIVKLLVERGADIKHATDSHSTPLRGAAFDGHIGVMEYLINKGADIDAPNMIGQSPLAIAAARNKAEGVKFLIANGADLHFKGHNGDTPLHKAVGSGSFEAAKVLIESGAKNTPNDVGHTPAIVASCYGHHNILDFLKSVFTLGNKELYDCYCLLLLRNVLSSDVSKALEWASKAVSVRACGSFTIPESNPIYDGIQEPSTMDEAKNIIQDDEKGFFLCGIYSERILGPLHPMSSSCIRICGDITLGKNLYDKCMQLWLRSLDFDRAERMAFELQIAEDMLFSVWGFTVMIEGDYFPKVSLHFESGMKELSLAKASKTSESDIVYFLCRMLAVWLKAIDTSEDEQYKTREFATLQECARKLFDAMKQRNTALLVACLGNVPIKFSQQYQTATFMIADSKLPLHKILSLFLDYGCPLNSEDESGNFLLHLAVTLNEDSAFDCVRVLVEAGAHVDSVNHNNQTPLEMVKAHVAPDHFDQYHLGIADYLKVSERKYRSLQCLCANVLVEHNIAYKNILPGFLISFVSEHESSC